MSLYNWQTTPREWFRLKPIVNARRRAPSPEHTILWERLRRRQLRRLRFRQHEVIGSFLADFFTYDAMLAIVIETPYLSGHLQTGFARTRCFNERSIEELRFPAERIRNDIDAVLEEIAQASLRHKRELRDLRLQAAAALDAALGSGAETPVQQGRADTGSATSQEPGADTSGRRGARLPEPCAPGSGTLEIHAPASDAGPGDSAKHVITGAVDNARSVGEPTVQYSRWQETTRQWFGLKMRARSLRTQQTEAERVLWNHLRRRQVLGLKFRRQHVIGSMVVDFYCPEAGIVIEVDGAVHDSIAARDEARDHELLSRGLTIIHVTNDEILDNIDDILTAIANEAAATLEQNLPRHARSQARQRLE